MMRIEELWDEFNDGLVFANLVDFDMLYGHRRDPAGYAAALAQFDSWLGNFLQRILPDDLVINRSWNQLGAQVNQNRHAAGKELFYHFAIDFPACSWCFESVVISRTTCQLDFIWRKNPLSHQARGGYDLKNRRPVPCASRILILIQWRRVRGRNIRFMVNGCSITSKGHFAQFRP
jgi:hypothetical protein